MIALPRFMVLHDPLECLHIQNAAPNAAILLEPVPQAAPEKSPEDGGSLSLMARAGIGVQERAPDLAPSGEPLLRHSRKGPFDLRVPPQGEKILVVQGKEVGIRKRSTPDQFLVNIEIVAEGYGKPESLDEQGGTQEG